MSGWEKLKIALTQVLGLENCNIPMICEGGAALYVPSSEQITYVKEPFDKDIILSILKPESFRIEPGKLSCLSLYPQPGYTVNILYETIMGRIDNEALGLDISTSAAAVDIVPKGANKAGAIRILEKEYGILASNSCCIGDSRNDLSMFEVCKYGACPNNASEIVKENASYISSYNNTRGVEDILKKFSLKFGLD